jgi:murein DD-endopeptidase MepM/ murein hydrolase activator NlpD
MEKQDRVRRRGFEAAGASMALMLLLAACGPRIGGPAPMVTGEQPPPPAQIIVQSGQTLSGIAHAYHVPMSVVADANHLSPPYRILIGQALIIPGSGEPPPYGPAVAMTEPMPPASAPPPPPITAPPPPPVSLGPPQAEGPPTALTPPGSAPSPPTSETATSETLLPPAGHTPPPAASAAKEIPAVPGPTASAEPPPSPRTSSGTFLWPVRGHLLEGYGSGPDGTHNDGINIAAPRGAAVQATDGGVVAYAGNELRGYGNLVLIKHPNGWISAYAHCDLILVKTGQKVARGQVIARVGSTGNVSEPQLHFELRRGKKPVDPREYLAPLPTAASKDPHSG